MYITDAVNFSMHYYNLSNPMEKIAMEEHAKISTIV